MEGASRWWGASQSDLSLNAILQTQVCLCVMCSNSSPQTSVSRSMLDSSLASGAELLPAKSDLGERQVGTGSVFIHKKTLFLCVSGVGSLPAGSFLLFTAGLYKL